MDLCHILFELLNRATSFVSVITQGVPWARSFWAFSPYLCPMRSSVSNYFESAKKMRKVWRFRKIIVNLQLETKD